MDQRPIPTDITVHKQSRVLEIHYSDGAHFELPCEYLRVYSPSAEVRGRRKQEAKLQVGKEHVTITDLQPIGHYAVKVFFDDGHQSGLYDWHYLYQLGQDRQQLWQDYLNRLEKAGHRRRGRDPFAELEPTT